MKQIVAPKGTVYEGYCVLMESGKVQCTNDFSLRSLPNQYTQLADLQGFTIGESHGCGLDRSGRVTCVGQDRAGLLGTGVLLSSQVPIRVP